MNQKFKLRFDQMRENNSEQLSSASNIDETENSYTERKLNIGFEWPNGRIVFYEYSHFISGDFEPNSPENIIKLYFSSETVTLFGYGLKAIVTEIRQHLVDHIYITDSRYVMAEELKEKIVTKILIEKRQD